MLLARILRLQGLQHPAPSSSLVHQQPRRVCAAAAPAAAAAAASARASLPAAQHTERIRADGSIQLQAHPGQQQQQQEQVVQQRQPGQARPHAPRAAPHAEPASPAQLERLVELVRDSRRVVVLTGAGCSTESNVPDYRGPNGAYSTGFKPMTHQQFVARPENRARYWARSFVGWAEFAGVTANAAHEGLARLQARGWVGALITQNVDRLHHKAGSPPDRVLELHGTTHRVVCMACGSQSCRHEMQAALAALNPEMACRVQQVAAQAAAHGIGSRGAWDRAVRAGTAADGRKVSGPDAEQVPVRRPDGDVELVDAGHGFAVPPCSACSQPQLKPDVVFFGDSVPKQRVESALAACSSADLLLVVGSSLQVWSAFRLAKAAAEGGAKLAIVNVGPTRADGMADLKIEALAGEVCMRLATHPSLAIPRI